MSAAGGPGSIPGATTGTTGRERPADLRSAELVSRLLAATPPYLYNMPIVPHSYFFSEMLRSFVHAKNNTEAGRAPVQNANQPLTHRRSRKRSWNHNKISPTTESSHSKSDWQHRSDPWSVRNLTHEDGRHLHPCEEKYPEALLDNNKNHQHAFEKPLELTMNKSVLSKHPRSHEVVESEEKRRSPDAEIKTRKSPKTLEPINQLKDEKFPGILPQSLPVPPALSLPPPPPPPLWYPPLYPPPYGIDPLNFFIDLRVSGHIYDRKHSAKDVQSSNLNHHHHEAQQQQEVQQTVGPLSFENNSASAFKENFKTNRHVSAFSVPKPRDNKNFPINLCQSAVSNKFNMKYYDDIDCKTRDKHRSITSTHYVMQNLKRIYGELSNREGNEDRGEPETEMSTDLDGANDSDSSETKRKRCKDLRALIGLELVVDYVKGGRVVGNVVKEDSSSADVEVLEDQ